MKLLTSVALLGACLSIPQVSAEVDTSSGPSMKERMAMFDKKSDDNKGSSFYDNKGSSSSSKDFSSSNDKGSMGSSIKERMAMFDKSGSQDSSSSSNKDSSSSSSDKASMSSSMKERMAKFNQKSDDNKESSSSSGQKSMGSEDKSGGGSLADRIKALEAKMQESNKPTDKVLPEVGDELGRITKRCEDSERAKAYNQIVADHKAAQASGKFDDFYEKYEKAWGDERKSESPGLKNLRDLGRYNPDSSKNQQVKLTKADMSSKGNLLKKLDKNASAEEFAEQLSIVHPSNDPVFSATMKCVADGRGWAAEDNQ